MEFSPTAEMDLLEPRVCTPFNLSWRGCMGRGANVGEFTYVRKLRANYFGVHGVLDSHLILIYQGNKV